MAEPALNEVAEVEAEEQPSATAQDTPALAESAKDRAPKTPVTTQTHKHQPIGFLPAAQSLIYVLVISMFCMTFTLQPIRIPSGSMEPTLLVGDFLLMNKESVARTSGWSPMAPSSIERGDVIVFHDPVDDPSVHLVKRVVGLPGDRLHLRDGVVYVNDIALKEPYAVHRRAAEDAFRDDFPSLNHMDSEVNTNWWIRLRGMVHDGDITVPAASYFVMGDNRNNSEDSRYWGFVPRDYIVGKPLMVYFSFRQPGSDDAEAAGLSPDTKKAYVGHGRWDVGRWGRIFQVVR